LSSFNKIGSTYGGNQQKMKLSNLSADFMHLTFDGRQKCWVEMQKTNCEITTLNLLNEEKTECTFSPMINQRSKSTSKRSISQFIADQQKYNEERIKKLDLKVDTMLEESQKNYKDFPTISKRSKDLLINGNSKSIVERLNLPLRSKSNVGAYDYYCLNKPKEQKSFIQVYKDKECVKRKIHRDIRNIHKDDKITRFEDFSLTLLKYGMLTGRKEKAENEDILTKKLWEFLGRKNKGVYLEVLADAISDIMDSSQKLNKEYLDLYLNKISQQKDCSVPDEFPHKPYLVPATVKLASKSRERRKQYEETKKMHGTMSIASRHKQTIADMLALEDEQLKKRLSIARQKKEEEIAKQCTFQPNISEMNERKTLSKSFSQLYPTPLDRLARAIKKQVSSYIRKY